ncbi:heat shock 70 kDa protein 1-like [Caerostris darwini]|uniref:Heat shock 70 kDa protein 1-like n=1 Tax=Caerostris darwini TaxID=1538125 RepID=A0AAV4TCH5_9ARAC|nr:heat shock 70 kDa protein 1-like [Caerostris darwini]
MKWMPVNQKDYAKSSQRYKYQISRMPLSLGIDLGTENACAAVYLDDKIKCILNEEDVLLPCYISFTEKGLLTGKAALSHIRRNPRNTVFGVKRFIGRTFDDPLFQEDFREFPFHAYNDNQKIKICVMCKEKPISLAPEEVSALILSRLKTAAEASLGQKITNVVLTIPAHFNDSQREATKAAGKIAGFDDVKLIAEPTAAAVAYSFNNADQNPKTFMVFHLGTGNFDLTVLTIKNKSTFELKTTLGDAYLGGLDFDKMLFDHFANVFKHNQKKDILDYPCSTTKMTMACEKAKIAVCTVVDVVSLSFACFCNDIYFNSKLTRSQFEELCDPLFEKIMCYLESVIKDNGIELSEIYDIILVGKGTRIPKIRRIIRSFFHTRELLTTKRSSTAVAFGAAIYAAIIFGDIQSEQLSLTKVVYRSIGIETSGNVMTKIINRNSHFLAVHLALLLHTPTINQGLPFTYTKGKVTFELNFDGILTIAAMEEHLTSSCRIIRTNNERLSEEEINQMTEDFEKYQKGNDEDKIKLFYTESTESSLELAESIVRSIDTNKLSPLQKEKFEEIRTDFLEWLSSHPPVEKKVINERWEKALKLLEPSVLFDKEATSTFQEIK